MLWTYEQYDTDQTMGDQSSNSSGMRFLSFADDKEDAEKAAKLREAALRIEQAIERQKSVSELVDYKPPPEEEIDPTNDTRPLYERLLEQKNKKQEALEESHKLSNLVTNLDEDEANYLNELARSKQEEEIRKRLEVYDVLEEKKRNSELRIAEQEKKLKESFLGAKTQPTKNNSLKSKLSSLIRVKPKSQSSNSETSTMVPKGQISKKEATDHGHVKRQSNGTSGTSYNAPKSSESSNNYHLPDTKRLKTIKDTESSGRNQNEKISHVDSHCCNCVHQTNVMTCIGVLPSLPLVREFPDSSDSDNSNDNLNPRIVPSIGGSKK